MKISSDDKFMRRALVLAGRGRGKTSPNPMVGCVIVRGGRVVSEGWHRFCGGDHAEVMALRKAGARAKGATMYVTLEPCSHWGRTPPCVDAVLSAGIRKVVVAMVDPNAVNNGKSLRMLRKAGVEVVTGVGAEEAARLNQAFVKYMKTGMPFVVAKSAQTMDGKIATRSGDSHWITCEESRAFARRKRNAFDAILVGVGTVLSDDPRLDAPDSRIRKVVLDSRLRTPANARLLKNSEPGQVIIATTHRAPASARKRLEMAGALVLLYPKRSGRVDMKWLLRELAREGITSVLIEGGASVIGSALKAGLVDCWHVYIAPKVVGDERAKASVAGLDVARVALAPEFKIVSLQRTGKDVFIELCLPE
ncbi:MAG: bifunctional diaminohydroxyphosphoribosylaminopyrimidine deaminase/5-amino-6-(5-phosphoribosylamino)uracil reductase RibD [Candidatus Omnitrophica bacterium]|nr:bifunctional diaminohydroxyphosphoribosylaminopyrimidine deaminase/5-amino-6-(5-phosphoribosylamino)uracil reductase RibD [Candidatus Omnitrophota bacterium]